MKRNLFPRRRIMALIAAGTTAVGLAGTAALTVGAAPAGAAVASSHDDSFTFRSSRRRASPPAWRTRAAVSPSRLARRTTP